MNSKNAFSESAGLLVENLIEFSSVPLGIIEARKAKNNEWIFTIISSSSLIAEMLESKSIKNEDALNVFNKIKGFNSAFIIDLIESKIGTNKNLVHHAGNSYLKLSFSKIQEGHLSFTVKDITDQQLHKIELAEKKRQLKESHKIAKLGYWVENYKRKANIWSDQVYSILDTNSNKTAASFDNYLKFVHPDDVNTLKEQFESSIKNRTSYEISHRIVLQNKTVKYIILRCYTDYDSNGVPLQSVGIIQDISTFEKTKIELNKSEAIFRSVFENAPIAIVLVNSKLKPVFSNNQFSDITGYSIKEIIQKGVKDFTHIDDYEHNVSQYEKLFNKEIDSFTLTKRYLRKDGNLIWVKVIVSAIAGLERDGDYAIAMVQDISSEKTATEALIRSENRYRTLIESASDGIGLFDINFNPILYNTSLYKMLGYSIDEYLNIDHSKFELFHPEDRKYAIAAFNKIKEGKPAKIENRLRVKGGDFIHCSISYIPVYHEDKPAILLFRRDISKRKNAEIQNEEYRMFLETIMDNLPLSFFAKTTPDLRYMYWNKTMERATGISADNALGKTDFELFQFKSLAEQYRSEDEKIIKTRRKIETEHDLRSFNGDVKYFRTIKTLHESSTGSPVILGLSMDISELKEAQLQIEKSTQMLKEAQKIAKLGYWEFDVKKNLFFDNIENRQILGTDKLPYFINKKQFLDLVIPADKEMVKSSFALCIKKGDSGNGIVRIHNNDKIKHITINYIAVKDENGKVAKLRGTCLDITRIRNSQISLQESEKKLKQAEHIAKIGYWNFDYNTNQVKISDEIWNIFEMSKKDDGQFDFSEFMKIVHPDDMLTVAKLFHKSKSANKPFAQEFKIITVSGQLKYIKAIGTFVRNSNKILIRAVGTFQDITESKLIQNDLENHNNKLVQIQEIAKIGFFDYEIGSPKYKISKNINNLFDFEQDNTEIDQKDFENLLFDDDKKTIIGTIDKNINIKEPYNIKYRILTPKGNKKYIREKADFYINTLTNKTHIRRIIQDLTEVQEKESALINSLEYSKEFFLGSFSIDLRNGSTRIDKSLGTFLNLNSGDKIESLINKVHNDDRYTVKKTLLKSISLQEKISISFRVFNKFNETISISLRGKYDKDVNKFRFIINDITEKQLLDNRIHEKNELVNSISDNSIFAILIFKDGYHTYVNRKWCELIGMRNTEVLNKAKIEDIYMPESAILLRNLMRKWNEYNLKEYSNRIVLKPIHAPEFSAEVYIKELILDDSPSFLLMAYPLKK